MFLNHFPSPDYQITRLLEIYRFIISIQHTLFHCVKWPYNWVSTNRMMVVLVSHQQCLAFKMAHPLPASITNISVCFQLQHCDLFITNYKPLSKHFLWNKKSRSNHFQNESKNSCSSLIRNMTLHQQRCICKRLCVFKVNKHSTEKYVAYRQLQTGISIKNMWACSHFTLLSQFKTDSMVKCKATKLKRQEVADLVE